MATPGSASSRSFSENSMRRETAAVSERRANSSGTMRLTKLDSPRGSAHR